jgi:DNA-binding response OmpR family regulator
VAKILYIDWDERLCGQIREFLAVSGHECLTLTQGTPACDVLRETGAELVIAEVMMPDVCGFEICRRVRSDAELFTTPVMLVSHMAAEEEIQHGLGQGADDYLAKPFDPNVFHTRVMSLLANAGAVTAPDPLTGLVSHRLEKYLVQQRISSHRPFALVCLELVNLVEFGRKAGADARSKALQQGARILIASGKLLDDESFQPAHMGAGHFMCLVEPEMAEQYCDWVHNSWTEHLPRLYSSMGLPVPTEGARGSHVVPCVKALVYCTICSSRAGGSVQECFETLASIRDHARQAGGGIYADRRTR